VRHSHATDTRLLIAGVVASLALVGYLAVAFANTHASSGPGVGNPFAPWVPHASKLARIPRQRGLAVRVTPAAPGNYGALVPTLVSDPKSGRTYVVGLWLKGPRAGRIGVSIDEFAPGATSVYLVNTTVRAAPRWRHFTFRVPVAGSWLGLGMYVYGLEQRRRTWFAVRDLRAGLSP
jgi:hypothetical protein